MKSYYDLLLSVYAYDTNYFIEFVHYEFNIAIKQENKDKRISNLRAIQNQLLLVYGIKVEGVRETPSKIVDLLEIIDSLLSIEK